MFLKPLRILTLGLGVASSAVFLQAQDQPVPMQPAPAVAVTACSPPVTSVSCHSRARCGRHGPYSFWATLRAPATEVPELGAAQYANMNQQRANALGEYFVIFQEDWLDETEHLNATGERHFDGIARRLNMIGDPIRVEPLGKREIDAKRRGTIVVALMKMGMPEKLASDRVVMGMSRAEGLRADQIEAAYYQTRGRAGMSRMGMMGGGMGMMGGGMGMGMMGGGMGMGMMGGGMGMMGGGFGY